MNGKVLGGILLIVGTSIGAGMLALPVTTAAGGFYHSLYLFVGIWAAMTLGAFFILEVNMWLPTESNLISMARSTLGRVGEVITWIAYLALLYSLMSAYTAGGSDLLDVLFAAAGLHTHAGVDATLFVLIFALIVFQGVRTIDFTNRGLMAIKFAAYLLLVILIAPHVNVTTLWGGEPKLLVGAVMVVVTSFGYAVIIPSLRDYFDSDVNALRLVITIGSLTALMCYVAWDCVVQGTINSGGPQGLIAMANSGKAASQLTVALSSDLSNPLIDKVAHIFSSVCITTSFLGVSLSLSDFLEDGLHLPKSFGGRSLLMLVTFLPPLLIVIFNPAIFIHSLSYAGVFCVLILILLPALMVYSGRYVKKMSGGYRVFGGLPVVLLEFLVAIILLIVAIIELH